MTPRCETNLSRMVGSITPSNRSTVEIATVDDVSRCHFASAVRNLEGSNQPPQLINKARLQLSSVVAISIAHTRGCLVSTPQVPFIASHVGDQGLFGFGGLKPTSEYKR